MDMRTQYDSIHECVSGLDMASASNLRLASPLRIFCSLVRFVFWIQLVLTPCFSALGGFVPGGVASVGLTNIVPDVILFDTNDIPNLTNWEPYTSVLGTSTFLIVASTFAIPAVDAHSGVLMQRFALAFQPVTGGTNKLGDAFFADDGTPYRGQINRTRQASATRRVAGDKRPGAVNFIVAGNASPHYYPYFQSDDRWTLGFVRSGLNPCFLDDPTGGQPDQTTGHYSTMQIYSLDPTNLVQTMLCKAQDSANGRLTSGRPLDAHINRLGGDLAALDNGNFVSVVHDRSGVRNPGGDAAVATIFAPDGSVVRESFVVENRDLWSNVVAYRGGFAVRVHENLYFYDNAGNLQGLTNILSSGIAWITDRGDAHRIGAHINSPFVYLAGWVNASDTQGNPIKVVRLGAWDSRTRAFVTQTRVSEMDVDTIDRVNLAVDALDRMCVAYEVEPGSAFAQYQVAARVLAFHGSSKEFAPLTASFFPFVNYDRQGSHGIRTFRPSLAMTTRQICIAAKGEINIANNPLAGANTLSQTTFYTVLSHPDPQNDPTSPVATTIDSPVRSGTILVGDTLRLLGHGTSLTEREPLQFIWDMGDGRTSSSKDPGMVGFPAPGTNLITLDAFNSQGQHDLTPDTRTITVIPDTNSIPDLEAAQLNVPGNLGIGQPAHVTYIVRNAGDGNVSGKSWKDALYLSRDGYLDVNDRLLVSAAVSNNVVVGSSYTNTLTVTLPTVQEGAYYLILSVNDEWQFLERHRLNNEFAVATDLVIPRLTNAVPLAGAFTGNGDEQYFRIDVPAGQNLLIRLNDLDNQGANEVYVRFGALPTRGTFDYRAATPGSADQQVLIPAAAPGTYYILVRGESVPGSGNFTIEATAASLQVTGVAPNRYGQSPVAVLTVEGAGFDASATVDLVAGSGAVYRAASASADSFTQLTATFDLNAVPVGMYALRVSSPTWGTNALAKAFEVLPASAPKLETGLIVPSQLGYHHVATIYVEYRNIGNAAMPAPLLVLTATQGGREGAFLTLQDHRLLEGFRTSADPEGFSHSIQILASGDTPGVLQPGDSVRVPVYYAGWQKPWDFSYPTFNFNLGVITATDTTVADWTTLKTTMRPATINAEAWEVIWAGFRSQVGTTWGDYVKMLDDNASYVGRLGQRVLDVGQLLAFEFLQADGLSPLRTLASAVDAAVEAPGLPLVFSRSFAEAISRRFELGPLGRGWSHNWQYSLGMAADGTVTVLGPGGSRRVFQPDGSHAGSYFPQSGGHATLTPSAGGAFSLREPAGLTRAFRTDGKLDYVQDPNGNRITCGYSGSLLTGLTHSSGQHLTIGYGDAGRITSVTDRLNRPTVFSYDSGKEHLMGAQYYDGRTASYVYHVAPGSALHALTEVANSCCTRRYFTYDAQGRLSSTYRDGNAETVTFAYDTTGKVTATDALGGASKFYFEHRGLLAKTEDALGNAVRLAFDDDYNLVKLTDPAGRSYAYAYDDNGNLTKSTDPLGHASRFTYHSSLNRLASVTDANTNLTRYAYTDSANLQSITYADGSREGWAYDALGNANTWTNRRGHPINYTHDTNGQLTSKLFADGSRAQYLYDPRGNLTNATTLDPGLATLNSAALSYDSNDRLMNIFYDGGRFLAFTYDAAGRRVSSLDQLGHELTYFYDPAGRLQSMTNELGQLVVRYEYDPAGRLAVKALGNGMVTTYGYNAARQLLTLTNRLADGTAISWFNYAYDTRGRRTTMVAHYGAWAYDYDDLGQLTRAVLVSTHTNIPNRDLTYVYDPLGNRLRTITNGVTVQYTVNKLNQYPHVGDMTYEFDADGNLVRGVSPRGTSIYTYGPENRLVAVSTPEGTWQYEYDALGNRVATMENGVTKRFVVDPVGLGNVVGEYDASGNLLAQYQHGLGLAARRDAAGNPVFYTFDALGSTHELTDESGVALNRYAYEPFGGLADASESLANPFQFVGRRGVIKDGNGLHFMRARSYSPCDGRFAAEDPIGLAGLDMNLYRYAANEPVRKTDPLGYSFIEGLVKVVTGWTRGIDAASHDDLTGSGEEYSQAQRQTEEGVTEAVQGYPKVQKAALTGKPRDLLGLVGEGIDWVQAAQQAKDRSERDAASKPAVVPQPPVTAADSTTSRTAASNDPNAKTGPAGFGANGFLAASSTLAYRVDFANETNATAPAQQVVVTDQLSGNLDWNTFRLAEVGFGDQLIVVPPNSQHFETNVPVSYLGTNFQVQIEAGIQLYSGSVYANFRTIDPATSLPPPVNIGFLPPEDGTGRGRGHVSYTIKPLSNLPTGTQIRNVAQISFDLQPSLATNLRDPYNPAAGADPARECLNTIDADSPSSTVAPIAAGGEAQFTLTWSGTDPGAGVASYDIYVSTNGGPWNIWLAGTTNTSVVFIGGIGQTYGFASVARDGAGNVEALPALPDAQTTVVRDTRVPSLHVEMLGESSMGVYWQAPQQMVVDCESSPTLGPTAVWTREEPDATTNNVVWLFVSPSEGAKFYRLKARP